MRKVETKEEIKTELAMLKSQGEAPEWMNWMSYAMLRGTYLQPNQTPKHRFRVIADSAAKYLPKDTKEWSDKFFDLIWKNHLALSTPVMANLGNSSGLAVSCSASYIGDTMWDIAYTDFEIAMLSKNGFGTAAYFDIRPGYSPVSGGGYTNSVTDWIEKYWFTQNKVSQGNKRRGSTALYFHFWHAELLKILPMLESYDKLHIGVICDDSVREALRSNDKDAWTRYSTILTWRARKGKPYIIFADNARRQDPPKYKELGLSTKQSNLCTEIFQHTDSDHTLACVLSSMVANRFDEWHNTDAVFNSIVFLDCINTDLEVRGSSTKGLERVVRSASKSRALGLGVLGFHTYLQQKMIPMDSFQATRENAKIFSYIKSEADRASSFLAQWLGEPEWCLGTGKRNTHLLAIAPNTSSALIAGGVSQGIEPIAANSYEQKLAKIGSVPRFNPILLALLREKGKETDEILDSIAFNQGSVQHLDFMTDLEKQVFKTAYEINQKVLIDLAEQRQRWICQGQSLNLFFSANEEEQWIHEVHKYAFEKDLLKSLYYVRTMAGISADKGDSCLACEG
jgi:ribonucleoside-diphosphate reductase alpha chain